MISNVDPADHYDDQGTYYHDDAHADKVTEAYVTLEEMQRSVVAYTRLLAARYFALLAAEHLSSETAPADGSDPSMFRGLHNELGRLAAKFAHPSSYVVDGDDDGPWAPV